MSRAATTHMETQLMVETICLTLNNIASNINSGIKTMGTVYWLSRWCYSDLRELNQVVEKRKNNLSFLRT